jgi:L-amino acid N-acyltransferase YncA
MYPPLSNNSRPQHTSSTTQLDFGLLPSVELSSKDLPKDSDTNKALAIVDSESFVAVNGECSVSIRSQTSQSARSTKLVLFSENSHHSGSCHEQPANAVAAESKMIPQQSSDKPPALRYDMVSPTSYKTSPAFPKTPIMINPKTSHNNARNVTPSWQKRRVPTPKISANVLPAVKATPLPIFAKPKLEDIPEYTNRINVKNIRLQSTNMSPQPTNILLPPSLANTASQIALQRTKDAWDKSNTGKGDALEQSQNIPSVAHFDPLSSQMYPSRPLSNSSRQLSSFEATYIFNLSDSQVAEALRKFDIRLDSQKFIKRWVRKQPEKRPRVRSNGLSSNSDLIIADFFWQQYDTIEGLLRDEFWNRLSSSPPRAVEPEDFDFHPWWTRYRAQKSMFLTAYTAPDAPMDKTDSWYQYSQDEPTTIEKCATFIEEHGVRDDFERLDCRNAWIDQSNLPMSKFRISAPSVGIYLRSAQLQDVDQLVKIYNHNIATSWGVVDTSSVDGELMRSKYDTLREKMLPFIVAVRTSDSKPVPGKGRIQSFADDGQEEIVGYAMADEYGPSGSLYFHTADLEIHVRDLYQDQKIGKALLDHMLYIIDDGYEKKTRVDWADGTRFKNNGSTRPFKSIVATVLYAPRSPHKDILRYRWMDLWLTKHGFKKAGELPHVASREQIW